MIEPILLHKTDSAIISVAWQYKIAQGSYKSGCCPPKYGQNVSKYNQNMCMIKIEVLKYPHIGDYPHF